MKMRLIRTTLDVTTPGSFEDVVELLVPELQKRGIYWDDYPAPGGTARENVHSNPGQALLASDHPGAKFRWNAAPLPEKEDISGQGEKTEDEVLLEEAKINGTDTVPTPVAVAAA